MGIIYLKQYTKMSCGGWSQGEISDEIREICKHEKVVGALATGLGKSAEEITFTPTSVEQQVVSGMNYKISGGHGTGNAVVLVWFQAWNGGVQQAQVESMTC